MTKWGPGADVLSPARPREEQEIGRIPGQRACFHRRGVAGRDSKHPSGGWGNKRQMPEKEMLRMRMESKTGLLARGEGGMQLGRQTEARVTCFGTPGGPGHTLRAQQTSAR